VVTEDCLVCRIVAGEIPATLVHEDDEIVAFRDIAPRAPTHVLVVPRRHIESVGALEAADAGLAGRLLLTAAAIARQEGIAEHGYRVVTNIGSWGGQTIFHLHLHLLGGRPLAWPPG
jgi:histidine triad (HIT) family protein